MKIDIPSSLLKVASPLSLAIPIVWYALMTVFTANRGSLPALADAAFWEIKHDLDKKPSVTVSAPFSDEEVVGKVTYIDNNNLTITFNAAFSGKAYLN